MDERSKNKIFGQSDIVCQCLNKNFISLQDEQRKLCVDHFNKVLESLVAEMKNQDNLFAALYQRVCGAGSYFDGLRVAQANEFDMDVVMKLPINYSEIIIENKDVPPAFVKVKITKALDKLRQHPRWSADYRGMDSWRDNDGYLLQTKFRTWMEGVVNKALNTFPKVECNRRELTLPRNGSNGGPDEDVKYTISLRKSGPAMTLNISMPENLPNVDVDLVPVIEFKYPQWPPHPVRQLDADMAKKKPAWFIVPKPKNDPAFKDFFWRLAFHDQEREMLHGKANLKPVCRFLKKFRDTRSFALIASYYIKSLFLWEAHENKDPEFWQKGLTKLFFHMLAKFHNSIKGGCIYYFWDNRYNLLEGMTTAHVTNYDGNLSNVNKTLNKKLFGEVGKDNADPSALADYLLTPSEKEIFLKLKINISIKESSPTRLLSPSVSSSRAMVLARIRTDGVQNGVQTGVQNGELMNADNQESALQRMEKMMIKMQKMVTQSNSTTTALLQQVKSLEGKVDQQLTKIVQLEDELKLLKRDRLPFTAGQQRVMDFLNLNSNHGKYS